MASAAATPAHPACGRSPTIYIVNNVYAGTVTPIRAATGTVLKPIKVGHYPDAIAITPTARRPTSGNQGSETVTPIRTAANTALKPVSAGAVPVAIAITPVPGRGLPGTGQTG